MKKRFSTRVVYFSLCFMLDSWASGSRNAAVDPLVFQKHQAHVSKLAPGDELAPGMNSFQGRSCIDCNKSRTLMQTPQIEKSNYSTKTTPHFKSHTITINNIVPEESENVVFSSKYSPQVGSQHDGFVPVPGPYGMKSRLATANSLKPTITNSFRVGLAPRNIDALKHTHGNHHLPRNVQSLKTHQSVQRRAQFRHPKAIDDLTVKESIMNENILGNGNFEIIRGGIFSDRDANEIIGSRRMGRGFGSFVVPTYQQSRFHPIRNGQFPPVYQARIQNSFDPVFYPRARY